MHKLPEQKKLTPNIRKMYFKLRSRNPKEPHHFGGARAVSRAGPAPNLRFNKGYFFFTMSQAVTVFTLQRGGDDDSATWYSMFIDIVVQSLQITFSPKKVITRTILYIIQLHNHNVITKKCFKISSLLKPMKGTVSRKIWRDEGMGCQSRP
jgi:hypothetical protein